MSKLIKIGIYKITSPTGKIYIGQSINIEKRWNSYYKNSSCKEQRILYNSLKKYGHENHIFEIIETLPNNLHKTDIINTLNKLEEFYIKKFNSFIDNNPFGMNLTTGGGNSLVSQETKNKISDSKKGDKNPMYGKRISQDSIKRGADSRRGKKRDPESVKKSALARTGLKRTDEFKKKMSDIKTGKKLSPETITKMIASRTGRKCSQETRDKISKAHLGRKKSLESVIKSANSKRGKLHSEETKLKISLATRGKNNPMYGKSGIESPNFGRKVSPETLAKLSGENHWTKRKEISIAKSN